MTSALSGMFRAASGLGKDGLTNIDVSEVAEFMNAIRLLLFSFNKVMSSTGNVGAQASAIKGNLEGLRTIITSINTIFRDINGEFGTLVP